MHCPSTRGQKIGRKDQLVVVVTHPYFISGDDMIELHVGKQCFVVDEKGNKDYLFDSPAIAEH